MNKHEVVLDMRKNKILFVFKRYKHNDNKVLAIENLSFLSIISFVIITLLKPTVENLNEKSLNVNPSKDTRKKLTPILKTFKKKKIQESDLLNIIEINILTYYYLTRSKENKLFSLTINKIYDTLIEPPEILSSIKRDSRISINDSYSCNSRIKYKKCCESYISKNPQINNIEILISQKVLNKLLIDYYNYVNVFDKSQTNILSSHRFYDHKLKFVKGANKNALFKSRIYSISKHKLEQVKKYLNEHLKKKFIVSSHTSFASLILFVEKPNEELRFYVDYKKLNAIIKRNRYSISLINEILAKIQGYKYLTRLNIITAFNKLRMHPNNENFTTFVISLKTYKYRMLPFELTNESTTYQQYINDILFEYLNDFCQAYLNNILIYNKTRKDHIKHIRLIL